MGTAELNQLMQQGRGEGAWDGGGGGGVWAGMGPRGRRPAEPRPAAGTWSRTQAWPLQGGHGLQVTGDMRRSLWALSSGPASEDCRCEAWGQCC